MIKSMYSAVTGLKGHQTMLDVIGNNIANVNTVGYKSSRVLFKDLYYQTLSASSASSTTTGGSNPTQIGYGSSISSIDLLVTRSGYQQTSRSLDMYISGEGYFIVKDSTGQNMYTRVGSFEFNADGTLIDSNGNFVGGQIPAVTTHASINKITINNFNNYTGVYIDSSGKIIGTNATTQSVETLGQVALATFSNPEGLSQEGNMNYAETPSSGTAKISVPSSATTGPLVSGGLEMSNVDLTKEFTDMIVAQRGFQANARVITTSDDVLEELVNLKR
jgi:flagellar hook protein FlgE